MHILKQGSVCTVTDTVATTCHPPLLALPLPPQCSHGMMCWCLAGMQSAALGFALAQKHFSDVMVCVPAAVSVVFMALGGSALAVFWRSRPTTD